MGLGIRPDIDYTPEKSMASGAKRSAADERNVEGLVRHVLKQDTLSGLTEMLKCFAESLACYGCILWHVAPFSDPTAKDPNGSFFVLAQWFDENRVCALHDLPFRSATGDAVLAGHSVQVEDVEVDEKIFREHPFLTANRIKSFLSVPLTFIDGQRGALNFYRRVRGLFPFEMAQRAETTASLVPVLYQAIRDKVSLEVIRSVNHAVQEGSLGDSNAVFHRIANLLSKTFNCVETSIFLTDQIEAPSTFRMKVTTWIGRFNKREYRASRSEGYTGWVLESKRSVRIFDLRYFERDKDALDREYPGIQWKNSLEIDAHIREQADYVSGEGRPLSVMASPILFGTKILGVVRCSVAPQFSYFGERDVSLLELVASQIAQYWNGILSHRSIQDENKALNTLVDNVSKLNSFVYQELGRPAPREDRIFAETFKVTNAVISRADTIDVRFFDSTTQELFFQQTYGKAWTEGRPEEVAARAQRRLPVTSNSAAAHVFNSGQEQIIADPDELSETFPGTRRIVVPFGFAEAPIGVMVIRSAGKKDFTEPEAKFAKLLGNQLGLYHQLSTTFVELRSTQADLKKRAAAQTQTFQDLAHQLKTPISQAYARARDICATSNNPEFLAVRGIIGKAKRVTISVGLFSELAQNKPLQVKPALLVLDGPTSLTKMLIEAAMDHELMIEPARRVRFDVNRASFEILRKWHVDADIALLEQAVSNVLDNAGKYSYSNTTVEIYGGLTSSKRRFHISIANTGIRIRPDEVSQCAEREWRSDEAKESTGEGSGIGLWIVKHIMQAHGTGADLLIDPTSEKGKSVVRLVFPLRNPT